MKTKNIILATLIALTSTACSTTARWQCQIDSGRDGVNASCKISGVWYIQAMNFIRPSINMLAETVGFTYDDWSSSDFSDFSLKVNSSDTSIKNNKVQVNVYQDSSKVGSKNFVVHRVGNSYYFSNPNSVKEWAHNFIDIADYTDVDFDLVKNSSGTVSVTARENNISRASATAYYPGRAHCDGPICYEEK